MRSKPSQDAKPSENVPHPHKPGTSDYHPGHHRYVERSYDKHSKLYHPELWTWHDLYDSQVSYEGSVVTRSQTAFTRKELDESDVILFGDRSKHHPANLPHLVVTMKDGTYGALPRTIVTRSLADQLEPNSTLSKTVDAYKTFKTLEEEIKPETSSNNKSKPSMFKRLFKRDTTDSEDKSKAAKKDDDKKGGNDKTVEVSPKPIIREPSFVQESTNSSSSGLLRPASFTANRFSVNFSPGYDGMNSQSGQTAAQEPSGESKEHDE